MSIDDAKFKRLLTQVSKVGRLYFFILFTGLMIMKIYHSGKIHFLIKIILIGGLTYLAKKYNFDYEIYGILTIIIFNIFRGKKILIFSSFLILNICPSTGDIAVNAERIIYWFD